MATPQAHLAARMSDEFGLDLVRFRHADCLMLGDGEVLKMFLPRSKRILGCGPQDRIIHGDLLFMLRDDLKHLRPSSEKYEWVDTMLGCPTANFSGLLEHPIITDGPLDRLLVDKLMRLINSLPNDRVSWIERFGESVFLPKSHDCFVGLVNSLRSVSLDDLS